MLQLPNYKVLGSSGSSSGGGSSTSSRFCTQRNGGGGEHIDVYAHRNVIKYRCNNII